MIKSISTNHEYCDRCIAFGKETDAVGHCLVCGTAICRTHTALTQIVHRNNGANTAYLFLCELCMDVPITGVNLLYAALKYISEKEAQNTFNEAALRAEADEIAATQGRWDDYALEMGSMEHNNQVQASPSPSDGPSPGCIGGC